MDHLPRPRILKSKCIEFDHCRYDGSMISSKLVEDLKEYAEFIPVCPEMAIGLPSPRESLRLVGDEEKQRLVNSNNGRDFSAEMENYAEEFLKKHTKNIDGAILKSKSPSCGIKEVKIYRSAGKTPSISKKGKGVFGRKVLEHHCLLPVEDEARLGDFSIREDFLTKIFLLAKFKEFCSQKRYSDLLDFHSRNKYMLMMYNQSQLKTLGSLLANHEKRTSEEVYEKYYENLLRALLKKPSYRSRINILFHIFGYFSKELNDEEKLFFLDNLEKYRDSKVPFSVPLSILHAWSIRFKKDYLKKQTIFNPFPAKLISVTDSGKGRER